MKIVHRIAFDSAPGRIRILREYGVDILTEIIDANGLPGLVAVDVDERHPKWPELSKLFAAWGVSDIARTEFSVREIETAEWLKFDAWMHGYPEPDVDGMGYL